MKRIIWFTGHSGSGKTTIAKKLQTEYNSIILDGDEMRKSISVELDFSPLHLGFPKQRMRSAPFSTPPIDTGSFLLSRRPHPLDSSLLAFRSSCLFETCKGILDNSTCPVSPAPVPPRVLDNGQNQAISHRFRPPPQTP